MKKTKFIKLQIIKQGPGAQSSASKTSRSEQSILLPDAEEMPAFKNLSHNTTAVATKKIFINLPFSARGRGNYQEMLQKCESQSLLIQEQLGHPFQEGMFTIRQLSREQEENSLSTYLKASPDPRNKQADIEQIQIQQFSTIKPHPTGSRKSQIGSSHQRKDKQEEDVLDSLMNLKQWKIHGEEETTLAHTTSQLRKSWKNIIIPEVKPWEEKSEHNDQQLEEEVEEEIFPQFKDQGSLNLPKLKMVSRKNMTLRLGQKVKSRIDIIYDCSEEQLQKIRQILKAEGVELRQRKEPKGVVAKQKENEKKGGIRVTPKQYYSNFISRDLVESLKKPNELHI